MRIASVISLLGVCLMAAVLAIIVAVNFEAAGNRDFVSYWASGQLLIHGGNPYDLAASLRLEHSAGATFDSYLTVLNPPLVFFLIAPLGFFSAKQGVMWWIALLLISLTISIRLLWILHGRPRSHLHLLTYCVPSVLACLIAGQIGLFLLLGVTLFLYFHQARPLLAGISLLLCCLKLHLFLPFLVALLVWAVSAKKYRVLAGIGIGILAACMFAIWLDPHAWSQYRAMMVAWPPTARFSPNLSKLLRLLVHRDATWLQFLPAAAGCCWASWYFWSRRERWNWIEHGSSLLLVSALCAPFSWFTDEVILIPPILAALYRSEDSGRPLLPFGLIAGIALAELLNGVWMTGPYLVWTGPAWLAWYLYVTYGCKERTAAAADLA